jgi:hypothetical protein
VTDKTKDGDFAEWLAQQVSAASLTDDEKKMFADWLVKENTTPESTGADRGRAQSTHAPETPGITMNDVRELLTWIKARVTHVSINETERKELNEWLMQRANDAGDIGAHDSKRLKQDLFD